MASTQSSDDDGHDRLLTRGIPLPLRRHVGRFGRLLFDMRDTLYDLREKSVRRRRRGSIRADGCRRRGAGRRPGRARRCAATPPKYESSPGQITTSSRLASADSAVTGHPGSTCTLPGTGLSRGAAIASAAGSPAVDDVDEHLEQGRPDPAATGGTRHQHRQSSRKAISGDIIEPIRAPGISVAPQQLALAHHRVQVQAVVSQPHARTPARDSWSRRRRCRPCRRPPRWSCRRAWWHPQRVDHPRRQHPVVVVEHQRLDRAEQVVEVVASRQHVGVAEAGTWGCPPSPRTPPGPAVRGRPARRSRRPSPRRRGPV